MEKFQIFESRHNNEELENEFHRFFYRYNLTALFTNEHRSTSISVTYLDAKSVVNAGGAYHETLKEFSEILTLANDNKAFEEAIFKIIYQARTFQGFMNKIKKLIRYIHSLDPDYLFNMWNIVFYDKSSY